MILDDPGEGIAKSEKVLALLTFCVSSTGGNTLERSSIINRRKSVGWEHRRTDHCPKRVNGAGVEADAGQETLQGCVGVLKVIFAIESPARFVDQIVADITNVGAGECVITAISLQKTESSERNVIARSRISGADKRLCVVNDIHAVFVCKIVLHAKSPQISSRTSGKEGLIHCVNVSGRE